MIPKKKNTSLVPARRMADTPHVAGKALSHQLAKLFQRKRKEVIRCLMVQQWGRSSPFGEPAAKYRAAGRARLLMVERQDAA